MNRYGDFLFYPVKSPLQHPVQPICIYFRLNLLAQILLIGNKKYLVNIRQTVSLEIDSIGNIRMKHLQNRKPMTYAVRTNIIQTERIRKKISELRSSFLLVVGKRISMTVRFGLSVRGHVLPIELSGVESYLIRSFFCCFSGNSTSPLIAS